MPNFERDTISFGERTMFDVHGLADDVRITARVIRRRAGFSATAIATLAVAIGANALLFTVVDRALLRPLPYAAPNALVVVSHHDIQGARNDKATGAEVMSWRMRRDLFSDVAFSWDAQYTLTSAAHPLTVRAFQLSTNFFTMLAVAPELGRAFARGDDVAGADHVVMLSDHLWKSEFGGAADVLGRVVRFDDTPYVVIGVMPARFAYPDPNIDLWTPLAIPPGLANDHSLHAFNVVARLAPGVAAASAHAALGSGVALQSLRDVSIGPARFALWALQAAVIVLLVIATANVANLSLAHATVVQREVAIRVALGASRWRVARQFFALGLTIAAIACAVGTSLASFAVQATPVLFGPMMSSMPADFGDGLSNWSIVVAIGIAVGIGLMLGFIITSGSRMYALASLSGRSRGSASGDAVRVRSGIIVAQFAMSVVLLASSGLLIRSFMKLDQRSLGFATDHRLTFLLQPSPGKYAGAKTSAYVNDILARLRAAPGVISAAATSAIPVSGMDARRRLLVGATRDSAGAAIVHYRVVSPDYFATMGIPVRRGRAFTAQDRPGAVDVALVNETAARVRFGGENPIGKIITVAGGPTPMTAQIVGIVGDVRHDGLAAEPQPELYRPLGQAFWPFFGIVVRTTDEPSRFVNSVQTVVWSIDRMQPVDRILPLSSLTSESVALRRTSMILLSVFAAAAALLAAIGVYGVVTYVVTQRTREIGIRIALGAPRTAVTRRIVTSGALLATLGAAFGILASFLLTRYLTALLFGVQPMDSVVLVSAVALTIGIAMAASYIPARRAAQIDPALTLREE